MEHKKQFLIINIILIGILILYSISRAGIFTLIITDTIEVATVFSTWMTIMNNFGLTFSKTLVLLIFPVLIMGIINNRKIEKDLKIIIGRILSFASIIILIVANFLDFLYWGSLGGESGASEIMRFIVLDMVNFFLYIIIYVLMKIKEKI